MKGTGQSFSMILFIDHPWNSAEYRRKLGLENENIRNLEKGEISGRGECLVRYPVLSLKRRRSDRNNAR